MQAYRMRILEKVNLLFQTSRLMRSSGLPPVFLVGLPSTAVPFSAGGVKHGLKDACVSSTGVDVFVLSDRYFRFHPVVKQLYYLYCFFFYSFWKPE